MAATREGVPTGNLVLLTLSLAVGASSLTTLTVLADDARWTLVPPLTLVVGLLWFLGSNFVRGSLRARLLRAESSRPTRVGVLLVEATASVLLLTALLTLTGAGTWVDRAVAALVGTLAGYLADRVVTPLLLARDAD